MMMKFDQHDINQWEMMSHGKTKAVICAWCKIELSPTIKKLLEFLRKLQVYGILSDANFVEAVGKYFLISYAI